jgi:hydrogenase/urease accessory protein HupE
LFSNLPELQICINLDGMSDFNFYFSWGWQHIISTKALDHILFIAALTVVFEMKKWTSLLVLVTAFTIGHFITLWLTVLDRVSFPSNWVEFLIPLTIVITALINMVRTGEALSIRIHYVLALFFGLIHGMGYANAIRFSLMEEQSLGWSLLAFNLGLELGQLLVVLIILLLGEIINRYTKLGRRRWVVVISLFILIVSIIMAFDRIPNLN